MAQKSDLSGALVGLRFKRASWKSVTSCRGMAGSEMMRPDRFEIDAARFESLQGSQRKIPEKQTLHAPAAGGE